MKPYEAFGNRAEDLYFALLKCRREGLRLIVLKRKWNLFWRVKFRSGNRELLNIRHPLVVHSVLLELVNYGMSVVLVSARLIGVPLRKLRTVLLGDSFDNIFVRASEFLIGRDELWGTMEVPFQASENGIDWEECYSNVLGVTYGNRGDLERQFPLLKDKRYVCLHVRTGGYANDHEYSAPRNANIENYIPAIRELTDRGYVVVRLGDPAMPPLHLDNVVDYAHSKARSEKNDILLVGHCDLYIGSQTGPIDVASLFEKRILTINCLSLSHYEWYRQGALFIPRKAVREGRVLTLKEQIDQYLFELSGTGRMVEGVEYRENTAEEVRAAVLEFLSSPNLTEGQVAFNAYLANKLREYFHTVRIQESLESQKIRWIARMSAVKGSICAGYLKDHWQ